EHGESRANVVLAGKPALGALAVHGSNAETNDLRCLLSWNAAGVLAAGAGRHADRQLFLLVTGTSDAVAQLDLGRARLLPSRYLRLDLDLLLRGNMRRRHGDLRHDGRQAWGVVGVLLPRRAGGLARVVRQGRRRPVLGPIGRGRRANALQRRRVTVRGQR